MGTVGGRPPPGGVFGCLGVAIVDGIHRGRVHVSGKGVVIGTGTIGFVPFRTRGRSYRASADNGQRISLRNTIGERPSICGHK